MIVTGRRGSRPDELILTVSCGKPTKFHQHVVEISTSLRKLLEGIAAHDSHTSAA